MYRVPSLSLSPRNAGILRQCCSYGGTFNFTWQHCLLRGFVETKVYVINGVGVTDYLV